MRMDERLIWGVMVAVALVTGWAAAGALEDPKSPPRTLPPEVPFQVLQSQIDELKRRADEQAKIRCLNVVTDRMDLAIFPVENLGVKRGVTK